MKDNFNRYVWINFGMVFGVIAIGAAAISFFSGDIVSRSSAISADHALIVKQNNILVAFSQIKKDSAEATEYKTAMDKLLPTQNEIINFPQWLQNLAGTYNVTADFSFTANAVPAASSTPGTIGFSLIVDGEGGKVVSFLKDLESEAPAFLLAFDSFTLTKNGANSRVVTGGKMFFR